MTLHREPCTWLRPRILSDCRLKSFDMIPLPTLAVMTGLSSEEEAKLRSRSTCKMPKDVTSTNRLTI
jgi:hypothetical protein